MTAILGQYDEALVRSVAAKLFKPRNQWPVDELVARAVETLGNSPVVDRRLKELSPSCRSLLAAIGWTRQAEWSVGRLLELLATLGHAEGLAPILTLLDQGLALPILADLPRPLRDWESWLGTNPMTQRVLIPPVVAERATREGTGLEPITSKNFEPKTIHVSDGLEWLLRLGVVWQQLRTGPLRLTQSSSLFKRDQQRLEGDPLLSTPVADQLVEVPDPGVLAMRLGMATGLFIADGAELRAGRFSPAWDDGLIATLGELWSALPGISHWDPLRGHEIREGGEPFSTVALAAMLLLAAQPEGAWTHPADLAAWLHARHPYWASILVDLDEAEGWIEAMGLGWGVSTRLLQAARDGEGWWLRLSPIGRHLLAGGPAAEITNPIERCLVVQPNADIIAYRQGLTPALIARLSRFADWKMLGPACTLGLSAESVYRGLEAGLMLSDIVATLQQHSGHPVPANVLDLLRRWAGKRERISVYTSATLLEFTTTQDLESAVARGLVVHQLSDRMGLVDGEVDYKHFRLLGNRDYEARPQKCVTFDADGVSFRVDLAAADLLLEAELGRLAEPLPGDGPERNYRITPASARTAREQGTTLAELEQWFANRSGEPLSASARLLLGGGSLSGEVRRMLVVTLPTSVITDGVCQWPPTADLLQDRLGPCAVAVAEEDLPRLAQQLRAVGIEIPTGS